MPINADQFRSIPLNWSELIDIGINARILIGIDQHWSAMENWSIESCIHFLAVDVSEVPDTYDRPQYNPTPVEYLNGKFEFVQ